MEASLRKNEAVGDGQQRLKCCQRRNGCETQDPRESLILHAASCGGAGNPKDAFLTWEFGEKKRDLTDPVRSPALPGERPCISCKVQPEVRQEAEGNASNE